MSITLRLPDGIFFSVVSGYRLMKMGHSSSKIKLSKSKKYFVSTNIKKKKLEILREATKEEIKSYK